MCASFCGLAQSIKDYFFFFDLNMENLFFGLAWEGAGTRSEEATGGGVVAEWGRALVVAAEGVGADWGIDLVTAAGTGALARGSGGAGGKEDVAVSLAVAFSEDLVDSASVIISFLCFKCPSVNELILTVLVVSEDPSEGLLKTGAFPLRLPIPKKGCSNTSRIDCAREFGLGCKSY